MTVFTDEPAGIAFDQMTACAERLILCLIAEREALLGETPEGLETICAAKLSEVQALEALGAPLIAARGASTRTSGRPGSAGPGLVDLAGRARWRALETLIARCNEANRANGSLLDQYRRRTRGLLAALTAHHAPVYGRGGYVSASLQGRVAGCA